MTTQGYLRISARELGNIKACLAGIETVLFADPQIPRLMVARDKQSLQALDRVQQELGFIASFLASLAEGTANDNLDEAMIFLENSPLRSMAERFELLQRS